MSIEETTNGGAPVGNAAPQATPPAAAPAADTASKAAAAPPAAAPATPAATPAADTASKAITLTGDNDDIPTDAELLSLTKSAFRSRMERHTKKELRERFGTDDFNDIKAKFDKLAAFEQQQEEQRLAGLSELEREREARAAAEAKAAEWENKFKDSVTSQVVRTEHSRVERIASQYLDSDYLEDELPKLARYLTKTYSEAELENLPDAELDKYFKERIAAKPKLAKDFTGAPPTPVVPLSNGPKDNGRPAPQAGPKPEVNFSPTATNAMSRMDARAEARRQGYDY